MTLTFEEENEINRALLKKLQLRLADKPTPILEGSGQIQYLRDPADTALIGSVGPMPDPDFSGPQAPNSMGIVSLVEPESGGEVVIQVSGRFDYTMRRIPEFAEMKEALKIDSDQIKPSQTLLSCYVRRTMVFEGLTLRFRVPGTLGAWQTPKEGNLDQRFIDHISDLETDDQVFRRCRLTERGNAKFFFEWDESITDQATLNAVVANEIFDPDGEILRYQPHIKARLRKAPPSLVGTNASYLCEIYLVNETTREYARKFGVDQPNLLDCELTCDIIQGHHRKLPHRLTPSDYAYYDSNAVPGYGITCGVIETGNNQLRSTSMPISEQPRFDPPEPADIGMTLEPTFDNLIDKPGAVIDGLVDGLYDYDRQWQARIQAMHEKGLHEEARIADGHRRGFVQEIERVEDGSQLLKQSEGLKQAFQSMNLIMKRAIQQQGKPFKSWRLFQLGFIVTQIRAIHERHCAEHDRQDRANEVDVLWFSTGGGKTEAYLGIISLAMLYARMNGRIYGTSAWMRFPLRMLSVQQFQRLSYVVAQANILRCEQSLGGFPFTIGYFTGNAPKKITEPYAEEKDYIATMSEERLKGLKYISDCPYCDARHSVRIERDIPNGRIKHVCNNEACWSNQHPQPDDYGESIHGEIGIYVSDEECYRYLPTVMVGTVDKLAVIAHNIRFKVFFGAARHFCPHHGFTLRGRCQHHNVTRDQSGEAWQSEPCPNNSKQSSIKTRELPRMLDPGFPILLQDELHLLRENLGNFDSHYESTLLALQTSYGGQAPKIMAATATIKDYESHVHHLYQRQARRFPAPGIELGESFYSRETAGAVQRFYAGILPLGRGQTAMRAVSESNLRFFELIKSLHKRLNVEPDQVAHELGIASAKGDALYYYLGQFFTSSLIYVNNKRSIGEVERFIDESPLVKYKGIHRNLDAETTLENIFNTIEEVENKSNWTLHEIIATSVVSHGVDIDRLNFMTLAGWPKSIAEYIQTTARAGRTHPGIILTVFNYKQLYECNVFMDFKDYHYFMDKMVESVPINRFAPNILDRTFPGLLTACLLLWATQYKWGKDITAGKAGKVRDALNNASYPVREELHAMLERALSVPEVMKGRFDSRIVDDFNDQLDSKIKEALNLLTYMKASLGEKPLSEAVETLLGHRPMQSFRDIENQIEILADREREDEPIIDALVR